MSLDALLSKTSSAKANSVKVSDIEVILPPEYEITIDRWREMIEFYNRTGRQTKLADAIQLYIRQHNPDQPTIELFTVGEIVEREGRFFADAFFIKTKPGLTALYIQKAEDLKLIAVSSPKGEDGIRYLVLAYVPD